MMEFIEVNGVRLYAPEFREELIEEAFQRKKILVAVNAEKILMADRSFAEFISDNIGYPDGIGAVMVLKKHGLRTVEKIPGVELWLDIIQSKHREKTFYLIGGKEEVIQETVSKLKSQFPEITILGFRNGYLKTQEERSALIADIVEKKPDVVFVAMGSPKQEKLMKEMHAMHPAVYQGLGGSLDVYTGRVERAPQWWVKNKLEWAYRLVREPKRIKRQIHLVKFLRYLF